VLSTVGVSYLIRHAPALRALAIAGEGYFVGFVTYGLAVSLIASAARVIRRRDTVILLLAATIAWVVFVEVGQIAGMLRFLVYASAVTVGVRRGGRLADGRSPWVRAASGVLTPAAACGVAGTAYYGLAALSGRMPGATPDLLAVGATSGIALGLAVGPGLWAGGELLRWMNREGS